MSKWETGFSYSSIELEHRWASDWVTEWLSGIWVKEEPFQRNHCTSKRFWLYRQKFTSCSNFFTKRPAKSPNNISNREDVDATDSCSAESSGKGDNLPPGKGLRQKDLEKIHQNGPGIFDQVYTCIYKYHILSYYVKIYVYTSIYLLKLYSCIKHISIKKQINTPLYPMFLPKRCDVSDPRSE